MTKNEEIYIGLFPPEGDDWRAMMAVILGHPHYQKDESYIDSRLNAIWFRTEMEEGNIVGNRIHLWVSDRKSFAVLLYRLDELYDFPPNLHDKVIEIGESWLSDLLSTELGLDENQDYLLLDVPPILSCPTCGELPPNLELQDMVYLCHKCGWQANYQTEWPYLCYFDTKDDPHWVSLGKLDEAVSRQMAIMDGRKRIIEMYYGVGDSDGGEWHVVDVEVNVRLPEKEATELAYEKLYDSYAPGDVAFAGVYCYWDDDMMRDFWNEQD